MSQVKSEIVFAGFWKRVGAGLIDGIIGLAISLPISIPMLKWQLTHNTILLSLLSSTAFTAALIFFITKFGGTPGKLFMEIRIVDSNYSYLKWPRALLRILFPSLLININSILQLISVNMNIPSETVLATSSMLQIGELMQQYGQPYTLISTLLAFSMYADFGAVLFNNRKKALHDYIANTVVITKSSYDQRQVEKEAIQVAN